MYSVLKSTTKDPFQHARGKAAAVSAQAGDRAKARYRNAEMKIRGHPASPFFVVGECLDHLWWLLI